jgi:P27 family predicted phage terminase small subunit
MGKRGPRRTPTAVKVARGTHRKDRDGDPSLEPQPEKIGAPAAPTGLGKIGRAKWKQLAPRLSKLGLLTEQDLEALSLLCEAYDEKESCEKTLKKEGDYYLTASGLIRVHPAVTRLQRCIDRIRNLMASFGMTPSDRSSMKVQTAPSAKKVQARARK